MKAVVVFLNFRLPRRGSNMRQVFVEPTVSSYLFSWPGAMVSNDMQLPQSLIQYFGACLDSCPVAMTEVPPFFSNIILPCSSHKSARPSDSRPLNEHEASLDSRAPLRINHVLTNCIPKALGRSCQQSPDSTLHRYSHRSRGGRPHNRRHLARELISEVTNLSDKVSAKQRTASQ
jgi:hypothetical protein